MHNIMNLKQKLDSLRLNDERGFKMLISLFQEICDEIAKYGQLIDDASLVDTFQITIWVVLHHSSI